MSPPRGTLTYQDLLGKCRKAFEGYQLAWRRLFQLLPVTLTARSEAARRFERLLEHDAKAKVGGEVALMQGPWPSPELGLRVFLTFLADYRNKIDERVAGGHYTLSGDQEAAVEEVCDVARHLLNEFEERGADLQLLVALTDLYSGRWVRESLERLESRVSRPDFALFCQHLELTFSELEMALSWDDVAAACVVTLNAEGEGPLVYGEPVPPLNSTEHAIITALIEAGPRGLSGGELNQKGSVGDGRRVLERLKEKRPQWDQAILMPGRPGGRYRLQFQHPRAG